jgi:DNA-binding transcriptional LysR family regulator
VNAAYPNVELEIEVDISANLRERLAAKDLHVAFLLAPANDLNIHSRPLCTFAVDFIAATRLKLPRKKMDLAHIAEWPIVTFARNTQPYAALRELFSREGLRPTIHASASLATVVRMALDGIGIAVMPPAILKDVAAGGKLRPLKTNVRLPPLNFVVAWPASPASPAAQKVVEIALEVAQKAAKNLA